MTRHALRSLPLAILLLLPAGCGGPAAESPASENRAEKSAASDDAQANDKTAAEPDGPFVLGDLIKPFDPPTLEEVDASAGWIDQPVVDSLERLRAFQATQPEPITADKAIELRNDSPANNEKIRAALGLMRVERTGDTYGDEPGVDWDAEITRYATSDINSTNGVLSSSTTETEVGSLTGFGLFSFDWQMLPFAAAEFVESWQTSKDGLMDKVVMRDDMTWSDGQPITAHDIVFSFRLIMSEAVPVPAVRQGTNQLRWVEAYDDQTLVYFHKQRLNTNVWNLNFPVLPKHKYEDSVAEDPQLDRSPYHVKLEDDPVLGGAYNIVRRKRGQEIVLERRESYYMHEGRQVRDKPFFKTVRFKIIPDQSVALLSLKKGDLDAMQFLDSRYWTSQTTNDDYYRFNTKVQAPEWLTWSFQWNLKTPFFSDKRVRHAMGYAFDHEEMLNNLRFGLDLPAVGTYHPDSPWCPDPPPEPKTQDLARARKLLREAGWRDTDGDGTLDKDGQPFEFSIICRSQQWRVDVCNLLAENLGRLGVVCNVQPLESGVVQERTLNHRFQAAFGGWGTGADPSTSKNIFGTDEGRNFGHYSSAEVDRLFSEGEKEFDLEKRKAIYRQIHQVMWEDQPYTWLFHQNSFFGFSKKLRGYTFSPRGPFSFGPGFGSIYQPTAP